MCKCNKECVSVPLTRGKKTIVHLDDLEFISGSSWYCDLTGEGRESARATIKRKKIRLHRFLMGMTNPRVLVDHHDHNPLNNARCNLRVTTPSGNSANTVKRNGCASAYKGVSKDRNKWKASISFNGERTHLGVFEKEEDAARAYDFAAIQLFGEFANLNFKT